jgi:hypothetical protein
VHSGKSESCVELQAILSMERPVAQQHAQTSLSTNLIAPSTPSLNKTPKSDSDPNKTESYNATSHTTSDAEPDEKKGAVQISTQPSLIIAEIEIQDPCCTTATTAANAALHHYQATSIYVMHVMSMLFPLVSCRLFNAGVRGGSTCCCYCWAARRSLVRRR